MRNFLAKGIHPRSIQKTSTPIRKIHEPYRGKIGASSVVADLGLMSRPYCLVLINRQENVDLPERIERVLHFLVAVGEK